MKYTTREKLGHFNKLRAASHLEADLELLKKLDPKHPLLTKASGGKEKYEGDILYLLLDLTTACDIKDFRREYHKSIESKKEWVELVTSYNKGLELIIQKYGSEYIIKNIDDIKDILSEIQTPYKPEDCEVFIGMSLSQLNFLVPIPLEPQLSAEYLTGAFESVFAGIVTRKETERIQDLSKKEALHADKQQTNLSEDQKVLGTKVSDYKIAQEPSEIEEKTKELIEKEDELDSRESDLDEKESELDEKEQELTDKEQELEEKAAVVEKKSVSKKPNTQK